MDGSVIVEEFGQKIDLTRRIREVLVNYPEGTTILKELIQNADDASATKVSFCLDRRQHGVESLLYKGMEGFQGPSLLCYNNAQFTDDDFESITRIGDSKKQGQASKTGRFGIGFNSVYHLSDLPSFVSGKYIVLFDPHCRYLPQISSANPGKRIDFVNSAALQHYEDQFRPYCAFGCNMKSLYPGTLFRLPLRTDEQAAVSRISKQSYSEENIMTLLHELYLEVVPAMLFLKNIEMLEIYDWNNNTEQPRVLFSCWLDSPTKAIRSHRQALSRISEAWSVYKGNDSHVPRYIETFRISFVSQSHTESPATEKKKSSYLIAQCMDSSASRIGLIASRALKEYDVHLLPWASVAADVSEDVLKAEEKSSDDGLAFCFLPLPVKTRLPVHVNGYFELSSNRRDIWYGLDMDRMGKLRSQWNTTLLEDVASLAYCQLISAANKSLGPCYQLWPSGSFVRPWQNMVDQFYKNILKYPVFYSEIMGGKYVLPSDAILHDEHFADADRLAFALIEEGLSIVRLPAVLMEMLLSHCPSALKIASPNMVRLSMKQPRKHMALSNRVLGLMLLDYCLSDIIDEEASEMLTGLPLIPLADGRFGVFKSRREDAVLSFVCSDLLHALFDSVKDRLVDNSIPANCLDRITKIACNSSTNIGILTCEEAAKLLGRILPVDWFQKVEVEWNPNTVKSHPEEGWIILLWQYLQECSDLSAFENWPILPTNNGMLCKLMQNSKLIRGGVLNENMERIVVSIGCRILVLEEKVDHPSLAKYVNPADGPGVLKAILAVSFSTGYSLWQLFSGVNNAQRRDLRAFLLDPKWFKQGQIGYSNLQDLRRLPVYEVFKGPGTMEKEFVDLSDVDRFLPPRGINEALLGPDFLCSLSQEETHTLQKMLKLKQMGKSAFYKHRVIDCLDQVPSEIRNTTVLTILRELSVLRLEDASIKDALRNTACIPTRKGELLHPDSLYDPRIKEFNMLLNELESFPAEEFQEPEVLDALLSIGLRTTISLETILESARQIEHLTVSEPEKARFRGHILLSYLEANITKVIPYLYDDESMSIDKVFMKVVSAFQNQDSIAVSQNKFWNELSTISWCPVLLHPPHPHLPWPSVTSMVAPPKLVRLPSDIWLVSASMRILERECHSALLCKKLGWVASPNGQIVAAQLLELGKDHVVVDDRSLRQALATSIPRLYDILIELLGSIDMEIVKAILEGSRWVWVGDGFANVQEVMLSGPLHLTPYLRVIPADLTVYKELLMELGVKETLTPLEFSLVLAKMAGVKNGSPLESHELRAAIWILQHLVEMSFHHTDLYIPDFNTVLSPISELIYNDAPWLEVGEVQLSVGEHVGGSKMGRKFVHPNVSNDVAERLGVNSLRRSLLAESAASMNISLHGIAEAFGQHEALTTRLKHIVEMYADGPGLLFELVQNADDAGATEVSFLMDNSHFGTSSLLSPGMMEWQGPALYCFNNSIFTEKDLYSISRIGQDSKLEKPHAVGRFGLGFNCVYHFTDLPGFVSGENLVMFDPHARYLPGISPSHPGLKVKFVGRNMLEKFPDQCRPYLLFGCDLQNPFKGTLFRFPLRTSATAAQSQIKAEPYSLEMVQDLFSSFHTVASETLLFLRNVTTITIYSREGTAHDLQMLYKVQKQNIDPTETKRTTVYDFIRGNQLDPVDREYFYKKLQRTPEYQLPWHCGKIQTVMVGGGVEETNNWIISDTLGGGGAKSMAIMKENRDRGFVPWAGVAVQIEPKDDTIRTRTESEEFQSLDSEKRVEGRAFCFLPLPVKTHLPVHVNGYFELSSNRRDIWYGSDMAGGGKLRSEWNRHVLQDAAAPAYARLLAKAATDVGPAGNEYYSLWPTGSIPEPWAALLQGVYLAVTDLELPVLYTTARGGQWISAKQGVFPDFNFPDAIILCKVLADSGIALVNPPEAVVVKFREFCPSLRFLTPHLLRSSLVRRSRTFGDLAAALVVLKYCLYDINRTDAVHKVKGLPLIPLQTGSFGTFTDPDPRRKLYVASESGYSLLKDRLPEVLVDISSDVDLSERITMIAESKSTNLTILTCEELKELLPRLLPSQWYRKEVVDWTPGIEGHPNQSWISILWNFLTTSASDLSLFSDWPLLPLFNGHLSRLRKNSNVLRNDSWSENMVTLLQKANCFILTSTVALNHPDLDDYVQSASAVGVLNALLAASDGQISRISELFEEALECEIHELRTFLLQMKWFSEIKMDSIHLEVLGALPIFESFGKPKFVNLRNHKRFLAPEDVEKELLDDEFIHPSSEKEEAILKRFMGLIKLGKQNFYEQHAFKKLHKVPANRRKEIMINLFGDLQLLMKESPSIISTLSQTSFVWTTEGSLEVPGRLYDPRISELQLLLNEKVYFPAEDFRVELILDVLAELGLKKLLDRDGLLDCARSVAMLRETNENEAMKMGQALLLQLNSLGQRDGAMRKHPESDGNTTEEVEPSVAAECLQTDCSLLESDRESFEEFWVQLATISWCPVYVNPPVPELPWQNDLKVKVASPKAARPKSQMWLVSASMRILDGDCSTMLIDRLGWSEKPSANVLALQLIELSKTYQHIKNNAVEPLEKIEHMELIYQKEIPSLYKLMQEFVDTEDLQILQTMLDKKLWVWMGGGFVQSKDVAFDSPAHFQPYLHIVPTELACFKSLFTALGVRTSFDVSDYISVLHRVALDVRGGALSPELLGFVLRVLEAVSENVLVEGQHGDKVSLEFILLPDAMGVLVLARDLVYNDAPWLTKSSAGMGETLRFVHADVQNELAEKLGAKSLRYLTLVDKEMTRDLPCLATEDIAKLLKDFGNESYLLFDLLEVADCCKARRVLVVHDKREHSQISTMQPTLGQFQGQALTIAFLGAELTTEEVCTLQTSAACKLRGFNKGYGSGLISSYSVTDLPMLVSGGCLYMFDPSGLVLPTSVGKGKRSSTGYPVGKVYAFQGTDLAHRFADQFQPFFINQNLNWATKNITLIRLPLRKQTLHDDSHEEEGHGVVEVIFESFVKHASGALLFLNSVEEVCLSTWEQGETAFENFLTVKIDPSSAILRNPFEEKKWRKFQISNIFGVPSMATKVHVIDILIKGKDQCFLDKWLIVLSLGSGQTKNMALDRRYLSYNLTPIAGVAAHISRNGSRASLMSECCVLSPLPLSWVSGLPVIILGHFMVSHNTIRHLFHETGMVEIPKTATAMPTIQQSKLPISSIWNRELMACVRDAYLELLLQLPRVPQDTPVKRLDAKAPMFRASQMSVENSYSYWPISQKLIEQRVGAPTDDIMRYSLVDRGCLSELLVKPLYSRLAELPVWQLHGGETVKSTEGMFLSNPRAEQDHFSPPITVCEYLKQHFKVFAVPWELVRGLELSGVEIKVITPKMVRTLVKSAFKPSPCFSVESFIDLMEYCCMDSPICELSQITGRSDTANGSRDVQSTNNTKKVAHTLGESSNSQSSRLPTLMSARSGLQSLNQELQGLANPPLNIVTNIGRASLGKALVKDLDREPGDRVSSGMVSAGQRYEAWLSELQGLPCPTATEELTMLGDREFWIGNREQQMLMEPLKSRFVHIGCLERPLLLNLFSDLKFQRQLKVKPFSMQVLSGNMNVAIPRNWIARTSSGEATPWVLWHESDTFSYGAPSSEWLRTFWKYVNPFSSQEITEFAIWPLVPAILTSSVLVKMRNKELVFIPPIAENLAKYSADRGEVKEASLGSPVSFHVPEHVTEALKKADVDIQTQNPWMYLFLQSCNIPLYNRSYFNCSAVFTCLQFNRERTLGQIVTSKILAAQQSGHFHTSSLVLSPEASDGFFSLLASDFSSANSNTSFYSTDELHLLRSLPIYKTSTGLYTAIDRETNCIVPTQAFFQPKSDLCLKYLPPDQGGSLYHILGVSELTDQEILLRFGLPGYMEKDDPEKECILSYIYRNWGNLQHDNSVLAAIKGTRFVHANGISVDGQLYQPLDLLDPDDTLLARVYVDDASKFPASQFTDERWLQILRKTGLRSSRDADLILECARKVESMGRGNAQIIDDASHLLIKHLADNDGVSTEILLLAEAVVKTILENFATFYSSSFCDSLSHIAIIPAERGIPNSGGRGSRKVLASFRDVVLMKDWPLAWTCSPILSKSNLIPPEFSWGFLHLRTPPPFSTVLQHLEVAGKNSGEDILARWPTSEGTKSVEEAFGDVLNYLSAKWNNLSDREKRALKSLPFIPIANGTRLSAASSLYVRLGINLAPFAFELPNVYLRHVKVLTDLGMRESPSLDSMRRLLLEIQDTIGYRRLNPNELRAVFQILQLMCEEAKIGNSDENVHEKLVEDAVIPDDTGRLIRAQACVYVDAVAASLVSKINSSLVRFAHPCFPEKLCVQLGVQKLSDVVVEVIHKDCSVETVEVLGSVSRRVVVNKLQSKSFQDATFAIVRSFSQQIPSLKFWTKENIEKCLNSAVEGLQFVRYLYTQLLMIPRNVDVTREASKSHHTANHSNKIISGLEVYAFVDQSKSRLIVAEPPVSVSLSDLLAVVISRLLDSPVCLPLSSLFNSPSGSEMDVVDVLRLPIQHDSDHERFSNGLQQIAPPGQEVPIFVASQAQNHPLRPFYAGEIVAWRPDANHTSKLRYGIVSEDVRPLSGQALYRLLVKSAPGEFQYMLSSNVFSFKTESSQDNVGSFTDAEMNSETTLDSLPLSGQETDGMAFKLEKQAKNAKAATKEVPTSEVVGVITDMLAAVGLPLDIESQSLLHQTLRLQEQLTASQTALLLEQERAEGAIKEAESAKTAWSCRVCLGFEVDTILEPCGHMLCGRCCAAVNRCPFCRRSVSKALRMYRP